MQSKFQFREDGETCGLLKLGSWIYPLHPKISPAFKTTYDAYIFPNNTSIGQLLKLFDNNDGSLFLIFLGEFVGLMFDDSVTPDTRQLFEEILSHYSVFMAGQGTPTVRFFIVRSILYHSDFFFSFSSVNS